MEVLKNLSWLKIWGWFPRQEIDITGSLAWWKATLRQLDAELRVSKI